MLTSRQLPHYVKPVFLLVMLSYVPPMIWFLLSGQGIYQHGYHVLLVLLASGPATGAVLHQPLLATFLLASLLLNVLLLVLHGVGLELGIAASLAALILLVFSVSSYYALWARLLYLGWKRKR